MNFYELCAAHPVTGVTVLFIVSVDIFLFLMALGALFGAGKKD